MRTSGRSGVTPAESDLMTRRGSTVLLAQSILDRASDGWVGDTC